MLGLSEVGGPAAISPLLLVFERVILGAADFARVWVRFAIKLRTWLSACVGVHVSLLRVRGQER